MIITVVITESYFCFLIAQLATAEHSTCTEMHRKNKVKSKLDGCIVWNEHKYSDRRLSVHKLFTSSIRRCLVSRACDWAMPELSAMILILSFQFILLFFHVCQPGSTAAYWFTRYRTSDVDEYAEWVGFL